MNGTLQTALETAGITLAIVVLAGLATLVIGWLLNERDKMPEENTQENTCCKCENKKTEAPGLSERDQEVICNKQLRVGIDTHLQHLKKQTPSRERALAITKLQEAIMWLGMDLKRLDAPDPYPESMNPNPVVHPTADGLKL